MSHSCESVFLYDVIANYLQLHILMMTEQLPTKIPTFSAISYNTSMTRAYNHVSIPYCPYFMFAGHLLCWLVFQLLWLCSCDVTQNTGLGYHWLTIPAVCHKFPNHWQNLTNVLLMASTSSLQNLLHTVFSSKTYYVCQSKRCWKICKSWASPEMCWQAPQCPCIQYWPRNL
jgi:hypothetical protein